MYRYVFNVQLRLLVNPDASLVHQSEQMPVGKIGDLSVLARKIEQMIGTVYFSVIL